MRNRIIYVLTPQLLRRFEKRKIIVKCVNCGKTFHINDKIFSKTTRSTGGGKARRYCLMCVKKLGIWMNK